MHGQAIEMLDGGPLPECPDCRRSIWEVIRDRLGANGERLVDVRCAGCGSAATMARQPNQTDWRMVSIHRG